MDPKMSDRHQPPLGRIGQPWFCLAFVLVCLAMVGNGPTEAQNRRALVVGIDHYFTADADPEIVELRTLSNLNGAVNDAGAMERLLADLYGFEVKVLLNDEATREAILSAIDLHLIAPTRRGDDVVFYFSGHGSQVTNSKTKEDDRKDETLVPADAAVGPPDIRDKELRERLNRVLRRGARLTVILDSCHSGSGARGLPSERTARYLDPMPGEVAEAGTPGPPLERKALILSAAQDFEVAREMEDEQGVSHGAFTLSLLRAIASASAWESVTDVFLRARSRLRAEGYQQEPVLAGPKRRRQAPLFGEPAGGAPRTRVGVLFVEGNGEVVILDGGWANGISQGSELRRMGGSKPGAEDDSAPLRLRVIDTELTRSRARIISEGRRTSTPPLSRDDFFELTRWAVPAEANLRVWMPKSASTGSQLRQYAAELAAGLAEEPRIEWITDPVAKTPTHILFWRGGQWWLRRGRGRKHEMGSRPEATELRREIPADENSEARLFVKLPLASDLAPGVRLGANTRNDAIELVEEPSQATYHLAGRWQHGELEYAWVRPDVTLRDEPRSTLPLRTRWLVFRAGQEAASTIGRDLEVLALKLGKIRAWLTLDSPRRIFFPYRLALKRTRNGEVKFGDRKLAEAAGRSRPGPWESEVEKHRRLTVGERYGVILLHSAPEHKTATVEPRYVYAFFIDSSGRSRLLFPLGRRGSVENYLPVPMAEVDSSPSEIAAGPQPIVEIAEPVGIDTYFLLTTSEPIPDPFVLDSRGVRSPDFARRHPLERLLRNRGVSTRNVDYLTSTTWSVDRVSFEIASDPYGEIPR